MIDSTVEVLNYLKMDNFSKSQQSRVPSDKNRNLNNDWSCSICHKQFKYPYTLMRHMPIHSKERKYKCDKCPKAFRQMSTLSQHKATHSSDKPYACSACGKSFNRGSTLISHRRTHQEIKRFACSICRKSFHQKGNLINHIYTHTNERPYKCDYCSRGFNQKSNLVCHMYTLHGKKKCYACEFCPASFSRENAYRAHLNSCHRLGAMPIIENDLNVSVDKSHCNDVSANVINRRDSFGINSSYVCKRNIGVPEDLNEINQSESNQSNVRVNILKLPKKPSLKIPALLNSRILENITNEVVERKSTSNPCQKNIIVTENESMKQDKESRGVVADIIITDMGRNLVIREKPPYILEVVRSRGEVPFLLVVEPGQTSRLCKAALGTEGFIVSPVTRIDLDRLASTSNSLQIPIYMTIKRILIGMEEVKTCILVHEKPIELSILLDHFSSGCSSVVDMALINSEINNINPIFMTVDKISNNFHIGSPIHTEEKFDCNLKNAQMLENYSESENIIRLHLSQVADIDGQSIEKTLPSADSCHLNTLTCYYKTELEDPVLSRNVIQSEMTLNSVPIKKEGFKFTQVE